MRVRKTSGLVSDCTCVDAVHEQFDNLITRMAKTELRYYDFWKAEKLGKNIPSIVESTYEESLSNIPDKCFF